MIVDLVAVRQTGKRRRPGVPADQRVPLRLIAGADVTVRCALVEPDGSPVALNFTDGDSLLMTGRSSAAGARAFGVLFGPDPDRGRGHYVTTLAGSLTKALCWRRGVYDVWAGIADGHEPVIPLAQLFVEPRAYDGQVTVAAPPGSQSSVAQRAFVATVGPGTGPFTVAVQGGGMPSTNYKLVGYVFTDQTKPDATIKFVDPDGARTTSVFSIVADGALDASTPIILYLRDFG